MGRLAIVFHLAIASFLTCTSSADDLHERSAKHERGSSRSRKPASFLSETAKHLSLAYTHFYHRHDSAGCMYAGLALSSMTTSSLTADQLKTVSAHLSDVKSYCTDDKITRHQVIKLVRDSVKVVNGRTVGAVEAADQ